MIVESVIVGGSLIASAALLFCGLVNQHTEVVYVNQTDQELMLELGRRTNKAIKKVTADVNKIASCTDGARQNAGSSPTEGSGPEVQPDSGQTL